jgi:hypothetical protein
MVLDTTRGRRRDDPVFADLNADGGTPTMQGRAVWSEDREPRVSGLSSDVCSRSISSE